MQKNILQYLEATVRRCPDKIAFSDGETAMTFAELHSSARAVGTALCRMGLKSRPIAVYMKKSPATLAAFLGALYAGCYYVPLDDEMPRHRIELILQKLDAGALICDADTENDARNLPFEGEIRRFDDIVRATAPDDECLGQIRRAQLDTDPIYVVFTSGSTGVPKGVVGCHRAVIDYIEGLCEVLSFDESTVFGNQTPLYFDACLKEIIPTLKYGATTYLIPKSLFMFPVKLVEYINAHGINTLCWVVSAMTMISSMRTFDKVTPDGLRLVAFASEVFPARQLRIWCDTLPDTRFVNLYGPTESTGICCYYEVPHDFDENEPLPIGQPLPNTEILLLDENNRVPPLRSSRSPRSRPFSPPVSSRPITPAKSACSPASAVCPFCKTGELRFAMKTLWPREKCLPPRPSKSSSRRRMRASRRCALCSILPFWPCASLAFCSPWPKL